MRRFIFAWWWGIAAVLALPTAAQVAPIELQPGESITISAAECAPTCVPSGPELCTGGVDEDCDGAIDCADPDCATVPACEEPEPGEAPAAWGRYRWDDVHGVDCETGATLNMGGPASPGDCVHHFLDAGGHNDREPTQFEAAWWGAVSATGDSIVFDNVDDQYVMNGQDWAPPSGPFIVAFVARLTGNTTGGSYLGSQGQCPGTKYYLGLPNQTAVLKKAEGSFAGGGITALAGTEFQQGERFALLTIRRAGDDYQLYKREPCAGWRDVTLYNPTTGAPPNRAGNPCFGCWGCYYPNGWLNDPSTVFSHGGEYRELALIEGDQDEQAWRDYLDAEHGAWIDEACP